MTGVVCNAGPIPADRRMIVTSNESADTGLAPNTGFDYRVRSVLAVDGETFRSAWSGTAAGRTNP